MSAVTSSARARLLHIRAASPEGLVAGALLGGVTCVTLGLLVLAPDQLGLLLLFGAVGLVAVVLGLRNPVVACTYLLVTTFFRLAIPPGTLPVDPFVLAFAGALASTWLWLRPWERRLSAARVDPIACVTGLYILWNLVSLVTPHLYPVGTPRQPEVPFSVSRFVLIGTVMPLVMFLVARRVFVTERAIRVLLWSTLVAAAYSAAVSIFQFIAPQLVWPTYIVDRPSWADRAVGVFNQPVVNGLVLVVGFVVAVLLASHSSEGPLPRALAGLVAVASVYAIYLTHTRVVWLSFALVVLIGAVVAKGFRTGFVVTGVAMVGTVVANWSTFTSEDRSAGGVSSPGEIQDRLNSIATSLWAFSREPFMGWGIGRFPSVNTYHHQQWSPEVPWVRGFGISSHLDSLGILVELGITGLILWLTLLVLIYTRLVRATRRLQVGGMYGRALGLTALLCLIAQSVTSLTVDLRFFDFPNIIVMALAGAAIGWQEAQGRTSSERQAGDDVPVTAEPGTRVRETVQP